MPLMEHVMLVQQINMIAHSAGSNPLELLADLQASMAAAA